MRLVKAVDKVLCRGFEARPDDLAVLMLTSGSTGYAKAVCLTHGQILNAVEGKSKYHGTTSKTKFLNWIGLDHVANLTEIHLHAMSLGSEQVHVHATDFSCEPTYIPEVAEQARDWLYLCPELLPRFAQTGLGQSRMFKWQGRNRLA